MDTFAVIYDRFKEDYPQLFKPHATKVAFSVSKFEELAPWNLKHAKQESCLCKACENFGMYETALSDIVGFLNDAMLDGASDVESIPKDERDPILSLPQYLQIDQLNKFKRCIEKVESMWCSDAFEKGKMGCIDPGGCGHDTPCDTCGFKSVWSQGLRPELLDDNGDLQDGVNPAWLAEVKWSRYKTETDSDDKKTLRGERTGSVIEFFDEFEKMFKKHAYHRYILYRTRASNMEFDRAASLGMLKLDVDWAENFTLFNYVTI